jgi:hypothetical protein
VLFIQHVPPVQEREELRHAATTGVTEDVLYYKKTLEYAEKLKAEKRAEKDAKARKKQLSFKEKEKRKRDAGQQASGTS